MTKRRRTIRNGIILGGLLIVLAAAYFIITAKESPAAKGVLYSLGRDEISEVRIENTFGNYDFYQVDGAWVVESNGVYRTNPEKVKLLLGCLEEFSITRMLPEELSEYGFDAPQARVTVRTAAGKGFSFSMGNEAVSGSSVYIKSGDDIMLTSTAMTSQLTGSLAAYRAKDVLEVDPTCIRSIEYFVNGERTLSLSNTDYHDWSMSFPFSAPARKVVLNELIAKLSGLVIAGYVDSTSDVADTGLSSPAGSMVLTDENGVTQTLDFGLISDTLQFVRIGGEADVVELYASDLDFSDLTPEGVVYIAPLDIPVDQVQSLNIQADGINDTLTLERGADGVTATLNGNTIDYANEFVSIFFKCITLNADGYDSNPAPSSGCVATCSVTTTDGKVVSLSLYLRDADTLYMYLDGKPIQDGQTMFYLDTVSLEELLYRLESIKSN